MWPKSRLKRCFLSIRATPAGASTPFNPAGYDFPLTDAQSHQVSLTFKVPKITCKKADKSGDGINTSISGTTSGDAFDAAGVFLSMSCTGTTASYSIFGIVDDSNTTSTIPVQAGDVISVAVIASTTFETASFADSTSGQGSYVDGTGFDASLGSVDVQGGNGSGAFPKFNSVTFSQIKLDDKPFSKDAPTGFNQEDSGGNTQISVGPISTKGTSFVDTYITNT